MQAKIGSSPALLHCKSHMLRCAMLRPTATCSHLDDGIITLLLFMHADLTDRTKLPALRCMPRLLPLAMLLLLRRGGPRGRQRHRPNLGLQPLHAGCAGQPGTMLRGALQGKHTSRQVRSAASSKEAAALAPHYEALARLQSVERSMHTTIYSANMSSPCRRAIGLTSLLLSAPSVI